MNCRAAQRLISAERDGPLSSGERTGLEAHVTVCAECRRAREALAAAAVAWRAADAAVSPPDVERAWQAIRREIRTDGGREKPMGFSWMARTLFAAVPVAAAAAIALVIWTRGPAPMTETPIESWTQFVEVDQSAAAPVVFVDQESGWVVVWASEAEDAKT